MSSSANNETTLKHNGITITFAGTGDMNGWKTFVECVQSTEYYNLEEPEKAQSTKFAQYSGPQYWTSIVPAFDGLKQTLRDIGFNVTTKVDVDDAASDNPSDPRAELHVEVIKTAS